MFIKHLVFGENEQCPKPVFYSLRVEHCSVPHDTPNSGYNYIFTIMAANMRFVSHGSAFEVSVMIGVQTDMMPLQ